MNPGMEGLPADEPLHHAGGQEQLVKVRPHPHAPFTWAVCCHSLGMHLFAAFLREKIEEEM
jgi:hypothetical protein